jgi:two-component system sensor histidine kinase KdpD
MAAGVGKTNAMLNAARQKKDAGVDVVIGCLEAHHCEAVDDLARSLEMNCRRTDSLNYSLSVEMDLDAILARRPQIAVVDDLARANTAGTRHPRRHQDVLELLDAGIDVYTTLNVQNLASRTDTVRQITGVATPDIVPDSVLDGADLELVDLTPEKLLSRIRENARQNGKNPTPAAPAIVDISGLTALREMALRLVAEAAGRDLGRLMESRKIAGPWKSGHRLLVGVGSGQSCERVIRWTRRLADSLNCPWIALYVEAAGALAKVEQSRVSQNLALARELGAEVITTSDEDVARGLLRVSTQRNVSQIVVGISQGGSLKNFLPGDRILRRLVRGSGGIDIHVVPGDPEPRRSLFQHFEWLAGSSSAQYLKAVAMVMVVALANYFLGPAAGIHGTAAVFLLAVVLLGLFLERGPALVAATLCALVWDYFFLPPFFDFRITHLEDMMLLATYFVIAIVLGQLTARNRAQVAADRQREQRAAALYLLTRELSEAADLDQILQKAVQQTGSGFKARVAILLPDAPGHTKLHFFPPNTLEIGEDEQRTAAWVLEHGQPAGKFTDNLSSSAALYVPLATGHRTIGAMGLRFSQPHAPTIHQWNLLDAFSQQISMALDRHRLRKESEKSQVLAESERLSKTLLDSMSHEIRTPLAVIKSAASNLIEFQETNWTSAQRKMIAEIHEATERLNRLAGNVLDMTRLESGHVKAKVNLCDVQDLIHIVVKDTRKEMARHKLVVEIPPELPLVQMDFVLMQQALVNLLSNAAFHTPPGTVVSLAARLEADALAFVVADQGPGIDPDCLDRVFEKFYRTPTARTGGTGLGLSLVKGFVEAQGGRVAVQNLAEGGVAFTIYLPVDKTRAHRALTNS